MPRKHLVLTMLMCPNLLIVLVTKLMIVLFQDAVRSGHRHYTNVKDILFLRFRRTL